MTIINYNYDHQATYAVIDVSDEAAMLASLGLCRDIVNPQAILGLLFLYKTEILVDSIINAIKKQIENRGLDVEVFASELDLLAVNIPNIAKSIENRHVYNYGSSIRLERFTTVKIVQPDKIILVYDPDGEYKDAYISV